MPLYIVRKRRDPLWTYRMLISGGRKVPLTQDRSLSVLFRKVVGTWHNSGLLHITAMGSPSDFPVCIYSLMAFIYVSCQNPIRWKQIVFLALRLSCLPERSKCKFC